MGCGTSTPTRVHRSGTANDISARARSESNDTLSNDALSSATSRSLPFPTLAASRLRHPKVQNPKMVVEPDLVDAALVAAESSAPLADSAAVLSLAATAGLPVNECCTRVSRRHTLHHVLNVKRPRKRRISSCTIIAQPHFHTSRFILLAPLYCICALYRSAAPWHRTLYI